MKFHTDIKIRRLVEDDLLNKITPPPYIKHFMNTFTFST